jgi:glycosyltransferase involved in cell wall biosynthesis
MQRPRVSIGLPVYNGQRYLEIALRSLVSQTYGDFELIISDNASTDRTAEICQDFAKVDPRVRYSRNEKNVGANPNFNRVLDLARGEYFRWAAYDDICQPGYLEHCVKALDADRGAVLAHTQTAIIDEAGRTIETTLDSLRALGLDPNEIDDPTRQLADPSPVKRFAQVLLHTKWCFEIFALMRTHVLRETGGHGDFYGSDKVILAYMALQGTFIEVPEKLFLRRHHAQQSSMIASAKEREVWSGVSRPKLFRSQKSCFNGYLGAISRSHLPTGQRWGCYGVIARYLMQLEKWPRALGIQKRRTVNVAAPLPAVGKPSV